MKAFLSPSTASIPPGLDTLLTLCISCSVLPCRQKAIRVVIVHFSPPSCVVVLVLSHPSCDLGI